MQPVGLLAVPGVRLVRVVERSAQPVALVGRVGEQRADLFAPLGGELLARKPDEGEQMAGKRARDQQQLGARPVGERHRGERHLPQRLTLEADQNVVRQPREHVLERLARVARGVEAELVLERREIGTQHGHLARGRGKRLARPQSREHRERDDLAPLEDRHDDEIKRDAAVDG